MQQRIDTPIQDIQDITIIGGGAAGLFCSIFLPKSLKKLILEHHESPGKKLLLSGGGRCNFSNTSIKAHSDYLSDNPHLIAHTLQHFGTKEMLQYLESNTIPVQEESGGKLFLKNNKSRELLDHLVEKSLEQGNRIQYGIKVLEIKKEGEIFCISSNQGNWYSKQVIIASGGKSFPIVGGSDFVIQLAQQHQLQYLEPTPGLCGILTQENLAPLSGSSVLAKLELWQGKELKYQESGSILFTHRGISGPVVFNTSLWIGYYFRDTISQLTTQLIIDPSSMTKKLFAFQKSQKSPKADPYLVSLHPEQLRDWHQAKIMVGGILLDEIQETFELKKIPGLFVIGEALNVNGKSGGYNLQWARSSAYICAQTWH